MPFEFTVSDLQLAFPFNFFPSIDMLFDVVIEIGRTTIELSLGKDIVFVRFYFLGSDFAIDVFLRRVSGSVVVEIVFLGHDVVFVDEVVARVYAVVALFCFDGGGWVYCLRISVSLHISVILISNVVILN